MKNEQKTTKRISTLDGSVIHIHECDLLRYDSMYLQLVFEDNNEYQRWVLRSAALSSPQGDCSGADIIHMQVVAFCPGCGLDCRKQIDWRVLGKPQFNRILDKLQKAGMNYSNQPIGPIL